ncbi:MAG: agmatinase [Nanoarchaeota archaeon]|nr:agmatinase [Nanoarchaeota archaeon]
MKEGTTNSKAKAEAIIIPVPYEVTASGEKGTAEGPKAVIEALTYQIEDYDRFVKSNTCEKVNIKPIEELQVKDLQPEKVVEVVKKKVDEIKNSDKFPIILGGEHSVSIGAIKSLKEKYRDLTVLQIDAHLDLRDDDSDYNIENPSKYAHCCVMRRARDLGCSTVQVGIRTIYSGELEYVKKEKILGTIFECPVKAKPEDIIKKIRSKNVYLTIDVDGIDPSQMPGTGTPIQGGLDWYYVIQLLEKLFEKKNVVGADIVEVSPLPNNRLTELGAAQLLYTIVGFKYKKILK